MASRAVRPVFVSSDASRRRNCRQVAAASFALSAFLFLFSPVSALWGLADAVRDNDVATLRDGMDWRAVRTALKDEIIGPASGAVATVKLASSHVAVPDTASDDDLPEFGSSFVSTVVSNAVDDEVTPERLLAFAHPVGAAAAMSLIDALRRLSDLRFTGPDQFQVAFRTSDQPEAGPVRLSLRIEHWHWKVVDVQMPATAPVGTASNRT